MLDALGAARRAPLGPVPESGRTGRGARPTGYGNSSRPSPATATERPVAYPRRRRRSRSSSPGSRRCSRRACRCAASRITAPGEYDTHSDQPRPLADGLDAHRPHAARLPARPRGARARRPRADACLVGVRPPRRGERERRDRPRRGGDRLPDRHPRDAARWSASSPAWPTLDDDGNLRATSDFRGVYCSLLEQWLGEDAAAVIPGASSFQRPVLVK